RGELRDWFSSTEIVIEAALAGLGFYLFLVHMLTAKRPFVDLELFKDRNFTAGMIFIFATGIIMLGNLALMPPFLQNLLGYPVLTAGYVLAPRGLGTMVAMMLVGRLLRHIDGRLFILLGLLLLAASLWEMSTFSLEV